jgi:DNA-binding response OmpR family regulator
VKVLLVSPDPRSRELMRLVVRGIERRTAEPIRFLEATNGDEGVRIALHERPDAIVAEELASRAGAFSLARTVRDRSDPYDGVIVVLLARPQDAWLARWSGADAWVTKPIDPFELTDRLMELVDRRAAKETA